MQDRASSPTRCGIVLAAGEGKRLQPFIQRLRGESIPKQYISFIGTRSMLEQTFDRAEKMIASSRLFTVTSQGHLGHRDVWRQLSRRPRGTVILQPENKETGPGLLLPLMHLIKRYPNSTVAVFPSDHYIFEEDLFMGYVDLAYRSVEQDPSLIVLLGVQPDGPEPEYGYILPESETEMKARSVVRKVLGFLEKPGLSASEELAREGGLWNTMVMVFQAETLLKLVETIVPAYYQAFQQISRAIGMPSETDVVKEVYGSMEPMNFSRGFLEELSVKYPMQLRVLPVRGVVWSDFGSEHRIMKIIEDSCRHTSPSQSGKSPIPTSTQARERIREIKEFASFRDLRNLDFDNAGL